MSRVSTSQLVLVYFAVKENGNFACIPVSKDRRIRSQPGVHMGRMPKQVILQQTLLRYSQQSCGKQAQGHSCDFCNKITLCETSLGFLPQLVTKCSGSKLESWKSTGMVDNLCCDFYHSLNQHWYFSNQMRIQGSQECGRQGWWVRNYQITVTFGPFASIYVILELGSYLLTHTAGKVFRYSHVIV